MSDLADLPALELLPAVDVVNGQAVRLHQGQAGTEEVFGDPREAVAGFIEQGARWIHLVDLDAAFGRGSNAPLLAQIVREYPHVAIELSGGIRDEASLARALDAGATRVNLGTAALEDPGWTKHAIETYGDRIAVGLDVRGQRLSARGWTRDGGDLWDVLARLNEEGCARYVVTDVNRDGTLTGPNCELLRHVCAATDRPVVASGGVSQLADIATLRALTPQGLEGVIIGKALYAGNFSLAHALEIAGGQPASAK
ncbi:bifunctional 1-(5-phosphoribosyl)-5-((5-phosphoribosylamino)methylideneamino)imidazole-4-carboxamide isomerase/phosphoribosylanthranilate isomerase PriA [Trueperella sp. LYQ143]|uniref:bifunctional 1-(5-phosphoribosyl)-5-((5- phosphoribosylamino)methylideneamino)imidazole-4- carboxamide isomerase/phosphoribosylanthranilate isomerase PriA n=1 Tax=unclassified Trueperella TaxID=2630174 RepID=UPI0039834747